MTLISKEELAKLEQAVAWAKRRMKKAYKKYQETEKEYSEAQQQVLNATTAAPLGREGEVDYSKFYESETWSLDLTIVKFALPRLRFIRENVCSYPGSYESLEDWEVVLDEIIKGFELYISVDGGMLAAEEDEIYTKSLELFFENFRRLWW